MEALPKNIRGPKLSPFSQDIDNIKFIRLLTTDNEIPKAGGDIPHSRVFEVRINKARFALKVFNFFDLEYLRPFIPEKDHLLSDNVIRHHLDPFFAECRAFGKLTDPNERKDDALAVRCHGYAMLPASTESQIEKQFGIDDWNRGPEEEGQPLRAIVKDYIRNVTPFGRQSFSKMRETVQELNKLGIYNMDIQEDNYLGGRLFDFSLAITSPHLCLWNELRSIKQILEDMDFDLKCFDSMVDREMEKKKAPRKSLRSSARTQAHQSRPSPQKATTKKKPHHWYSTASKPPPQPVRKQPPRAAKKKSLYVS